MDPLAHLAGSLVGKGNSENRVGADPRLDEVRDSVSNSLGLTRSCARYDEKRSLSMQCRFLLLRVEIV
jgi:hypothetical protein